MSRAKCRSCDRLPKANCGCCCTECAPAPRSIRRRMDDEMFDPSPLPIDRTTR